MGLESEASERSRPGEQRRVINHQPTPSADEQFEGGSAPVAKDEERARERIFLEFSLTQCGQGVAAGANRSGLAGE